MNFSFNHGSYLGVENRGLHEIFMPHDAGFVFDFGVRLPAPSTGTAFLFLVGFDPLFEAKSKKGFNTVQKCRFENVFDLNDFIWLFRVEVQLSH